MKEYFKNLPTLIDSVTMKIVCITKHNDFQVEIRDSNSGLLIWRAWDFEPEFEGVFNEQLKKYAKK